MNIDKEMTDEAREAFQNGATGKGDARLAQASSLLRADTGLARRIREAIEKQAPDIVKENLHLQNYILSYVCVRWLKSIEEDVISIFRGRAGPMTSRPDALAQAGGIVCENALRCLAGAPGQVLPREHINLP